MTRLAGGWKWLLGPRVVPMLAGWLLLAGLAPMAARAQQDTTPTQFYYRVFSAYYDGDYQSALKGFQGELRGGIKGVNGRWIDSICYSTWIGECYYQMGEYPAALEHYTAAMTLFSRYNNWLLRIQPSPLRQAGAGQVHIPPWGRSRRTARVAEVPAQMMMSRGQVNNNQVIQQGGVVQAAALFSIQAREIVRCTVLAMRRRSELLGPAGPHDPLNIELVAALARRPVAPNDWKDAWIDIELALAYASIGNDGQAKGLLQRGLVAAGQYDHNLTSTALFELGRIALKQGDYQEAASYFEEASYSAYQFEDSGLVEESLRFGHLTHLLQNKQQPYPPLEAVANWARVKGNKQLQVSALLMLAEDMAVLGRSNQAAELLSTARKTIGRRDMIRGKAGAQLNLLTAQTLYQQGKTPTGDEALTAALNFQRQGHSLWMFHIGLVDNLFTSGKVSSRVAMALYGDVLRDPQSLDWRTNPLESLSVLLTPHPLPIEHWFEVALARKEFEAALEISDVARRHRFFNSLALGGRLLGLRWMMEGPQDLLDQQAVIDRQDLLARYPAYNGLTRQVRQLRAELSQLPLVPVDAAQQTQQQEKLTELAQASLLQEALLREVAVRREPAALVFPPRRKIKEVQQAMPASQALLTFFATSRRLYGCLMSSEQYQVWEVGSPLTLQRDVAKLLREMGHYEVNREIPLEELADAKWQTTAGDLLDQLLQGSKTELPGGYDEIVIVPDNFLWYLPFEALQVGERGNTESLLLKTRVRYAPTISLSIPDARNRKRSPNTAVVVGKLFPNIDDAVAEAAFADFSQAVQGAAALRTPLPSVSSIYASQFNRLVVLDEIAPPEAGPYAWAPVTLDRTTLGSSLDHWLSLPWGGPDEVMLPGFHTPAENSLKKLGSGPPGADVFLSVCGLMATGSRTVLLSRWRTGGQTSYDLMREFARELPYTTASAAWQRSVFLVRRAPLQLDMEPRIRAKPVDTAPTASNPFFWSGYLLVDTGSQPNRETDQALIGNK